MNKRIKVLVSAVLAAVMLVICIPFNVAAADPTYTLCTGTLNAGDKVVIATADLSQGVSGQEGNNAVMSTSKTAWKEYTVEVVTDGYAFKSGSNYIATASSSSNNFKYSATAGVMTVKTDGQLQSNGKLLYINANNGSPVTRFYADKTNNSSYTPMYVFVVTGGGSTASCTHEYTNEYDAICNICDESRTVTLPAAGSTLDYATATKIGAAQEHNSYTANEYVLTGVVKTIGNTTYGNITIEDSTGATFYLYTVKDTSGNSYGYFTDTKPVVGDTITVKGPIGRFNSTAQMNPAEVTSVVPSTTPCTHAYTNDYDATCNNCGESRTVTLPAANSTLTFDVANKLGAAQDTETADKYYVIGKVTAIGNTTYGNMTIEDEDGNTLEIYGTYSADGATRYDSMETKPAVGDTVKLYGVMGQYNGTAQMENAWAVEITPAGSGTTPSPDTNDSVVAYIAVAVVALFGIAYVSKKH